MTSFVETVRSSTRLLCQLPDGNDECDDVAFSSQCESLQRVLQGRMSVAATGLEYARRGENHFVLRANVATIEEVLRRACPASAAQSVDSLRVGRSLRRVISASN